MALAARKQWRSLLRGLHLRSLSACPTDRKLFLTHREGVPATIIDGKAISKYIRSQLSREVKQLVKTCGRPPSLVVILVGDDPGSRTYVGAKAKAARKVGIASETIRLSKTVSESDLLSRIDELNSDDTVDGLLVQLPVPPHISTDAVCNRVRPSKDVDGYTVVNLGHLFANSPMHVPATARGIRDMVELCGFETEGKRVCVVGASRNVGAPIAKIFSEGGGNATVTVCHRFTTSSALNECSKQADILIVCAGKPSLITAEMVKPGAIVIDVGINEIVGADGEIKLMGDVDFAGVSQVAGAISPVPGGVGPLTVAGLLMNTVDAYQQHMTAESQRVSSNM